MSGIPRFLISGAGAFGTVTALLTAQFLLHASVVGWPPLQGMFLFCAIIAFFCAVIGFGVTEVLAMMGAWLRVKPRGQMLFIGYAAIGGVLFGLARGLLAAIGNSEMGQGQRAGIVEGFVAAVCYFPLCWAIMWALRRAFSKSAPHT